MDGQHHGTSLCRTGLRPRVLGQLDYRSGIVLPPWARTYYRRLHRAAPHAGTFSATTALENQLERSWSQRKLWLIFRNNWIILRSKIFEWNCSETICYWKVFIKVLRTITLTVRSLEHPHNSYSKTISNLWMLTLPSGRGLLVWWNSRNFTSVCNFPQMYCRIYCVHIKLLLSPYLLHITIYHICNTINYYSLHTSFI